MAPALSRSIILSWPQYVCALLTAPHGVRACWALLAPGPFVWVSSQPASLVASPPPPSHGQSYKAPQDLLSSPCFRQGTDAADGEMSQEDAEGAQPLLFQMNSQFLQLPAPSCMTMGEICFATHSPLYPPPWHTANPSLPPKPQLISRLHMATTCGSSAAGTSPGTA